MVLPIWPSPKAFSLDAWIAPYRPEWVNNISIHPPPLATHLRGPPEPRHLHLSDRAITPLNFVRLLRCFIPQRATFPCLRSVTDDRTTPQPFSPSLSFKCAVVRFQYCPREPCIHPQETTWYIDGCVPHYLLMKKGYHCVLPGQGPVYYGSLTAATYRPDWEIRRPNEGIRYTMNSTVGKFEPFSYFTSALPGDMYTNT